MASSNPTPTLDSPLQTDPTHVSKSPIDPPQNDSVIEQNQETNEVEEEESECGFCLFMKAGGCRDTFIDWEKCVEESEKKNEDIVDKCHAVTKALKDCMEAHPDHYGPILQAEKAAEDEARKEMQKEMDKVGNVESNNESVVNTIEVVATDSQQKVAS